MNKIKHFAYRATLRPAKLSESTKDNLFRLRIKIWFQTEWQKLIEIFVKKVAVGILNSYYLKTFCTKRSSKLLCKNILFCSS